jgi:hypothetical protein
MGLNTPQTAEITADSVAALIEGRDGVDGPDPVTFSATRLMEVVLHQRFHNN